MARYKEKERERDVTVLGEKTRFSGVLSFTEELHIAGKFDGTIDAKGSLTVKKGAICTVDFVRAASIIVEGRITGDLAAADRVEMRSGSSVSGNVTTSRLRIADKVDFEGSVEMIRSDTAGFDIFSHRSESLKKHLASE